MRPAVLACNHYWQWGLFRNSKLQLNPALPLQRDHSGGKMNSTKLTQTGGTHYTHRPCHTKCPGFLASIIRPHDVYIHMDTSWTFLIQAEKLLTITVILQERHLGTFSLCLISYQEGQSHIVVKQQATGNRLVNQSWCVQKISPVLC